ncbi:MAG TPA: DEAD/DEAH box helicase, partial [Candidatus Lokiarchaeia archaeon]
ILPIIEKLSHKQSETLILEPTRELAKQIDEVIKSLENNGIKSLTIYGGVSIENQINKLKQLTDIIVGTPGRIIDLYQRKALNFANIKFVVIDEGDRMLDQGFFPDISFILSRINSKIQLMLFSATLDENLRQLIKRFTKNRFEYINLSRDELTVRSTEQYYYIIDQFEEKFRNFLEILKEEKPDHVLIFCNTKRTVNWLFDRLKASKINYRIGAISGNVTQFQREKILTDFKEHRINLLLATDVAARGLDIENISHIINYDLPKYPEVYVHRIGRTSRMDKKGTAITLVVKDEYEYLCNIEGFIQQQIKKRFIKGQQEQQNRFTLY